MKAIGMNRRVLEMLLDRLDLEPEEDAFRGVIDGVTDDIIVTEISPLYPYVATSGIGVKVEVTTAAM